jgi:hypothetical protein
MEKKNTKLEEERRHLQIQLEKESKSKWEIENQRMNLSRQAVDDQKLVITSMHPYAC